MSDQSEDATPSTGSAPTDAHQTMNALVTRVALEVARRRQEDLPGLVESLQDDVVVITGGTTSRVYGQFEAGVWRIGERWVHELFLNADRRGGRRESIGPAEDVMVTLCHELCHLYAKANRIPASSRSGRYHNRRFAEIALAIGLDIEKDPVIGHRTPRLSVKGRLEYADLLTELSHGLTLTREPLPTDTDDKDGEGDEDTQLGDQSNTDQPSGNSSNYVSASCQCIFGRQGKVIARIAKGSWRPGVIFCRICGGDFKQS